METAIFTQALGEYLRFRRILPWLVLAFMCAGLAYYWPLMFPNSPPVDRYTNVASLLVFRILALSSAIFTTAILSQEIEGRTVVYLLTRPVPRWKLLSIRYAASVIVVSLLGSVAILLTSLGAFHGSQPIASLWHDLVAVVFGALSYGGLFLLFSLIVNRAMVYCLLFAFGWETSLPSLPGDLYRVSIYSYIQGIAQHAVTKTNNVVAMLTGNSEDHAITPMVAYISLSVLVVATVTLSCWWFTHFEYVPREDAE